MADLALQLKGPQPVSEVVLDILRRGVYVGPVLALVGGIIWGLEGASSVGYGVGLVLFNFWLSALLIAFSSRISLAFLMIAVLGGFLLRLGIIFIAFWLVKDAGWINVIALGLTIIITHLGLLIWEMKYVSASLAYPGLKPKKSQILNMGQNTKKKTQEEAAK